MKQGIRSPKNNMTVQSNIRKIAIFASGEARSAIRVASLFNEGNRLHVDLIVTDNPDSEIDEILSDKEVILLHVTPEDWPEKEDALAQFVTEKNIGLIALDNFRLDISTKLSEAVDGKVIILTSEEQAPREVVAAFEEKPKPVEEDEENKDDTPPTLEHEWAESLKINYKPPKVRITPPPVPELPPEVTPQPAVEHKEINVQPQTELEPQSPRQEKVWVRPVNQRGPEPQQEPMPPAYLLWSILSTVLCCLIPGIIAIIYSTRVSSRYFRGDISGAKRASRLAEIWIIVSVVLGIVSAAVYIPIYLAG